MRLFNQRDGILSLADARRDANLSRVGARDQYESDVADFKDSVVTDLENDFMSSDNTFMNPLYIPPSVSLDIPPMENIYDIAINTPTLPAFDKLPDDDYIYQPPFDDSIYDDSIYDDNKDGPYDPPQDPPQDPPVNTPAPRPMYRPPTDFSSGAPALNMAITPQEFGTTPGFEPPPPPRITKERRLPPPPPDRPTGRNFSIQRLDDSPNNLKFGGPLNAGIMRLPQSQQGDTMTTRIFQNAFKPRR